MATFDYAKARATAERLITKYGEASTVYTEGETGGEDALGNPLPDSPGVSIAGTITPLLPYNSQTMMTAYEKENVIHGDMYAYFHTSEEIKVNMLVDASGKTWRVQSVNKLESLDGVVLYQKLMLRS